MKELKFPDNGEDGAGFAEILPDQFIVTEKGLDQAVYEQFLAVREEESTPPADYADLFRQGKQLVTKTMPVSQKKLILVELARWGTAEAYRLLQEYYARSDSGLEEWSRIALYECRMRLEQSLLDVPVGLISTGLGGDGQRLRFIFVLAFQGEVPGKEQLQAMRKVLDEVCERYGAGVERAKFRASCLVVQVIVPMDIAVGEVIEQSIAELNQEGDQTREEYMATNVAEPTEEEIEHFLDGLHE